MNSRIQNRKNDQSSLTPNSDKKPGFLTAFWESCFNLNFYAAALKAAWTHVFFHTLVLMTLITIAYTVATFNPITKNLNKIFRNLPTVSIQGGKAVIEDKNVPLPYIASFPDNGSKKLYYIVDDGSHREELESKYSMYVLFSGNELIFNDSKKRVTVPLSDLQKDALFTNVFGDPIKITPVRLANFISSMSAVFVGGLFFMLVMFFLPLLNLLAAMVANVADKWTVSFADIYKLSFFAATPACLIQIVGCFLLSGTGMIVGLLFIAWIVQVAYLVTGLKACKESLKPV